MCLVSRSLARGTLRAALLPRRLVDPTQRQYMGYWQERQLSKHWAVPDLGRCLVGNARLKPQYETGAQLGGDQHLKIQVSEASTNIYALKERSEAPIPSGRSNCSSKSGHIRLPRAWHFESGLNILSILHRLRN